MQGLTAKEFRAWEHYAELEPFDELRQDYRVASILQILYNINRGKNEKPRELKDFLLNFGEPEEKEKPKKQTPEQQLAMLKILAVMHSSETPVAADNDSGQVSFADPSAEAMIQAQLEKARKAMN